MSAHSSVLRQPDELADLHIFVVPLELWLEKYRTAFNNIALESVSAGFVRVQPYVSLNYLRDHIEEQLGAEVIPEDYVFLRSVGRCMAVVKENQERLLKAKDFLPPVSYTPEIFILPGTHESVAKPVENAANTVIQTHGLTTAGMASVQHPHQFPGIPGGYMQYPQAGPHMVVGGYIPGQQSAQINQTDLQRRDVEAFNRSNKSISDDEGGSDNERSLEHAGRYQLLEDESGGSSENDEDGRAVLKERVEQNDNQQNEGQDEHREMASAVPSKMRKSKIQKKGSSGSSGSNQSEPKTVKFIQPEVYQGLPVTGPGGALISPPTPIPSGRVIASPLPQQPVAPVLPSERESHSEDSKNFRKAAEKEAVADKKKKGELKGAKKKKRDRSRSPPLEQAQPKELPGHLIGDNQVINEEHFEDQNTSTVFGEVTVSRVESPPSLNEVEERSKFVQFPSPAKGNRQQVMNGDFEGEYDTQLTNGLSDREGAFGPDNFLQLSDFGDHGLAGNDHMNNSYNAAVEDGDADGEGNVKDTLLTEDEIVGLSGKDGSKQGVADNAKQDGTKGTAAGNATKAKKMGKRPAKKPIENLEDKFKVPQIPKVSTPLPMKYPQRRDKEVGQDTASAKQKKRYEIEELKAELRKAKNARVDMEKEREGKVRRAKMLQNQMMQKRNQSKNIWKKKFFDEKRKTGALDEQVNRLRHEVDVQHKALMSYLDSKEREGNKPAVGSDYKSPSEKTNQRMSLVRLQHEVEELRRRIEELQMKLTAEMKNRDAAQKELKEIRQELMEKKINLTLTKSHKSLATLANPENIAV